MFTKESIVKAFTAINNNEYNKSSIFDNCDDILCDADLVKFNEALVTDELVEYINKNCSELLAVEFGDTALLGVLGEYVDNYHTFCDEHGWEIGCSDKVLYHEGKAFMVGYDVYESGTDRSVTSCTFIFDDGTYSVVKSFDYGDLESPLLTVIFPNDDDTPLLNAIDEYFPEEYRELWDV